MGDKIHDVRAHGLLAAELLAGEPVGAEVFPQAMLSVGHVPAKLTCEVTGHHTPLSLTLSRKGRGDKSVLRIH